MSPTNFRRMNIMLEVVAPTQRAHSWRASHKHTPEQHMEECVRGCFEWQKVLVESVERSCYDTEALLRMGIPLDWSDHMERAESLSNLDTHAEEVLDLLLQLLHYRGCDLSTTALLPPSSFAGLLSSNPVEARSAMAAAKRDWETLLKAERRAVTSKAWTSFMREVYFARWPVVRVTFMMLQQDDWQLSPRSLSWLRSLFYHIGDSRVVEQTHKYIRAFQDHGTSNRLSTRTSRFMAAIRAPVLQERTQGSETTCVSVDGADLAFEKPDKEAWKGSFFASSAKLLPKEFATVMAPLSSSSWRSASPQASFSALLAFEWLRFLGDAPEEPAELNTWRNRFLVDQSIVSMGKELFIVVAAGIHGALVWNMERVHSSDDAEGVGDLFQMATAGQPMRVTSIGIGHRAVVLPWVARSPLRTKGRLHQGHGPGIYMEQIQAPVPYVRFALQKHQRIRLLKEDIVSLLTEFGVAFKPSELRVDLLKILVEHVFRGEDAATIDEVFERLTGKQKTDQDVVQEHLEKNEDLSEAVDLLQGMDADSAQCFPQLNKVQKVRRRATKLRPEQVVESQKECLSRRSIRSVCFCLKHTTCECTAVVRLLLPTNLRTKRSRPRETGRRWTSRRLRHKGGIRSMFFFPSNSARVHA
jgi:hypothetical protein